METSVNSLGVTDVNDGQAASSSSRTWNRQRTPSELGVVNLT
jgi:hypothetical protein